MRCRARLSFVGSSNGQFLCRHKHGHEGEHSSWVRYVDRPGPDEVCWDEWQFTFYANKRQNVNGDGTFLVPRYAISPKTVLGISANELQWNCPGGHINRDDRFVTEGGAIKQKFKEFCKEQGIHFGR